MKIVGTSVRALSIALLSLGVLSVSASPVGAYVASTSGTSTSVTAWRIGSVDRHQRNVFGDDIRIDLESGPGIDARWYKCTDPSVAGGIKSDIYVSSGWREIGRNFAPGACFNIGYRGASATGSWTARLNYQANFYS